MESLLRVSNLSCERDDRLLFNDLSFQVQQGDIWRVEGPNGAGKTTLLRILSGLGSGFEGEVFWRDRTIQQARFEYQSSLLYIGHSPGVKAVLTPHENLRWYMSLHHHVEADAIDRALAKVGLFGYEDVPCYSLSAGQQRRVALARLFLSPAPLWILDEPFTAIDKQGVAEIEQRVVAQARRGGAVILTTHHELKAPVEVRSVKLGHKGNAGE